jgi:AcrR family transcriptional regulator
MTIGRSWEVQVAVRRGPGAGTAVGRADDARDDRNRDDRNRENRRRDAGHRDDRRDGAGSEPPAGTLELVFRDVTPDAARRMLIAAAQAFAARGFNATTTRDIARRARMSPAGVYVHYRSKEDLLFQVSRTGHELSLRIVREAVAGTSDPATAIRAVVGAFTRWHAELHAVARVVHYELASLRPDHLAEIIELRRKVENVIGSVISEGQRGGVFTVPDPAGATLAVLSLCVDVARWYRASGPRRPDELGALYADLVLRMLSHGR